MAKKTIKAKKGGGAKLSRSEVVTVRFDPKLRFAAELAARKQRRTVSSFIEWAVDEALDKVESGKGSKETVRQAVNKIWDVDEVDRFINLVRSYPEFLTHDEEKLWKVICNFENFWMLKPDRDKEYSIEKNIKKINLAVLRETFKDFKLFLQGGWTEKDFVSHVFQIRSEYEDQWGIK